MPFLISVRRKLFFPLLETICMVVRSGTSSHFPLAVSLAANEKAERN